MASWANKDVTNEHLLPYVDSATANPEVKTALQTLPFERNIFKLLANAPVYFAPFMKLLGVSFTKTTHVLPSDWQLTVLLTSIHLNAPYEYDVNEPVAQLLGFTEEKLTLLRAKDLSSAEHFTPRQQLVGQLISEIALGDRATKETMDRVIAQFGNEGTTELFFIHGIYSFLARFMNSARIDYDPIIPGLQEMLSSTFRIHIEREQQETQ